MARTTDSAPKAGTALTIIIVNYNGEAYLDECLRRVGRQTFTDFEVVVYDNASTDGSVRLLEERHSGVRVVQMGKNAGFVAPNNRGIGESAADYIMLLNADAFLEPTYLGVLIEDLEGDPKAGSASGKLYRLDRDMRPEETLDCAGHYINRDRRVIGRHRDAPNVDHPLNSEKRYVFGTPAAAGIYRREMLQDVRLLGEYLDEDFFAYFEDVDLDWRALLRGWKAVFDPAAVGYHFRGGTGVRKRAFSQACVIKNGALVIIKNDTVKGFLRSLWPIFGRFFREIAATLQASPPAIPLALAHLFVQWPRAVRKRVHIQLGRVEPPGRIEAYYQ
jgi:GT2 family glycosyltransferase